MVGNAARVLDVFLPIEDLPLIVSQCGQLEFPLIARSGFTIWAWRSARRYAKRNTNNQAVVPAIKMLIGDWYIDELGILTRQIAARD